MSNLEQAAAMASLACSAPPESRRVRTAEQVTDGDAHAARLELLQPHKEVAMDEDKVARNGNGSGPDMAAGSHAGSHPKLKQDDLARADRLKKYRFPKGQSGNPGGRPKRLSVTDRLRAVARISGANR